MKEYQKPLKVLFGFKYAKITRLWLSAVIVLHLVDPSVEQKYVYSERSAERLQDRREATGWQMRLSYASAQQAALLGLVLTADRGKGIRQNAPKLLAGTF